MCSNVSSKLVQNRKWGRPGDRSSYLGTKGVGKAWDKVRLPGNKGRLCHLLPTYGMNVNLKNIQQNCYAFFVAGIQNKTSVSSLIWEK